MFKNPFSFSGRIRRLEFWISSFLIGGFYSAVALPIAMELGGGLAWFVAWLPLAWFAIAQTTKRCHDIGNTGWMQLLPIYNPFWLLFTDSDDDNRYGPNPKKK